MAVKLRKLRGRAKGRHDGVLTPERLAKGDVCIGRDGLVRRVCVPDRLFQAGLIDEADLVYANRWYEDYLVVAYGRREGGGTGEGCYEQWIIDKARIEERLAELEARLGARGYAFLKDMFGADATYERLVSIYFPSVYWREARSMIKGEAISIIRQVAEFYFKLDNWQKKRKNN